MAWRRAQDLWLKRVCTKWHQDGAIWGRKFCTILLNFHFSIWEHRNDALHSADHRWKQEAREGRILQIVALQDRLLSRDLHCSDCWLVHLRQDAESMEDDP